MQQLNRGRRTWDTPPVKSDWLDQHAQAGPNALADSHGTAPGGRTTIDALCRPSAAPSLVYGGQHRHDRTQCYRGRKPSLMNWDGTAN
jgi:hypothetical protein